MRTIGNPNRGCGNLVSGGVYARGDRAVGGWLADWVWSLGQGIEGGHNLSIAAPPRGMILFNLPASLYLGRLVTDPMELPDDAPEHLRNMRQLAILDHVGSKHYTPYNFYQEVRAFGPSRRMSEDFARQIANYLPIPIVFTHAYMPIVHPNHQQALQAWAHETVPEKRWYDCSHHQPGWGLTASANHGDDHWLIPVLAEMDERGVGDQLHKHMPTPLVEQTLLVEQILGITWINRLVYVTDNQDSQDKLEALRMGGIEPVQAAPAGSSGEQAQV